MKRVRIAPDGTLYLLFSQGGIRRYAKAPGDCTFVRDMAFGTGGELFANAFDITTAGRLLRFGGGKLFVDDGAGAPLYSCAAPVSTTSPPLAASPDGQSVYVVDTFAPATSQKVTLTAGGCTSAAWLPAGAAWNGGTGSPRTTFATADAVYAGAERAVFAYGTDGAARPSIDRRTASIDAPDGICYTADLVATAAGIDVVDFNCGRIQRFATTGTFVASFDTAKLGIVKNPLDEKVTAMTDANGSRWLVTATSTGQALHRLPPF